MLVEILVNLGSNDYPDHAFMAGEEHDVPDRLGEIMVARRHARDVTPSRESVVAESQAASEPVSDKFTELRAKEKLVRSQPKEK